MSCISCSNKKFRKITNIKGRNIFICGSCGLAFVSPIPRVGRILGTINKVSGTFYKEYVKEKKYYDVYFGEKLEEIKKIKSTGFLLDVGCGPGTFLKLAQEGGFKVSGVELSNEAVSFCKKEGLNVYHGTINSNKLRSKRFDIITAFQLLEHVQKPDKFLNGIYRRLKPNGIILLTTPDREGIAPRILGKHWFGYYNLEHNYYFTITSLKNLINKAGFNTLTYKRESIRSINFKYIYNRMINYYYTNDTSVNKILNKFEFIPKLLDNKIAFKVPWASISLIAKKD